MRKLDDDLDYDPFKDITIALVICWFVRAWNKLNTRTISRCFSRCGFRFTPGLPNAADGQLPLYEEGMKLQQQEEATDIVFAPPKDPELLMDEAEKIIEQNDESVKLQIHDVGNSEQVLIENHVQIVRSHAAAFDAINTLILYAVGNGDVDVTID